MDNQSSNTNLHSPSSTVAPQTVRPHSESATSRNVSFRTQTINLGRGMSLGITNIAYAFTLPHRYHERILHEVHNAKRRPQILLSRRIGYLGSSAPVRYSFLAYLEDPHQETVKVRGAALNNFEAWAFKALIPLKDLGIGIAKILEHVAALPIHSVIPSRPSQSVGSISETDSFCDTG